MLIFELSETGRTAAAQLSADTPVPADIPAEFRRTTPIGLPEVSELQALRHYTNLDGMAGKLRQLIGEFRWGRMDALTAREAARAVVPSA